MKSSTFLIVAFSVAAVCFTSLPAMAQNAAGSLQQPFAITIDGVVVSST
jgi:hypothetical protein